MTSNLVSRLCEMPNECRSRGNVSMVALLREIGASNVSEDDVSAHLRAHPGLVQVWANYSEDQRGAPSWYLARPGRGLDGAEGWRVGFYALSNRVPERVFPDEFSACAFFIARHIEQLAG
jgi:hypothetical protein